MLEQIQALRHHSQRSYSQFGEDVHIEGYLKRLPYWLQINVKPGVIVDVGAYRPVKWSNTYFFHRRGWRTISIDPTPGSMDIFRRTRPNDVNLEIAIGQQNGESIFYLFGNPSVWNTMDKSSAREHAVRSGITPQEIPVKVVTLTNVLDEHLGDLPFELLSIDAEGLDLEILQSNDFDRFKPRIVLIEVHGLSVDQLASHPVVSFLRDRRYMLFSWINPNLMFVRDDSFFDMTSKSHAA